MPEFVTVRAIRWLITGLFVISMSTSAYVLYLGRNADDVARASVARIAQNAHHICESSNQSARSVNAVLDSLIEGAKASPEFSAAEKASRIARYRADRVLLQECK